MVGVKAESLEMNELGLKRCRALLQRSSHRTRIACMSYVCRLEGLGGSGRSKSTIVKMDQTREMVCMSSMVGDVEMLMTFWR